MLENKRESIGRKIIVGMQREKPLQGKGDKKWDAWKREIETTTKKVVGDGEESKVKKESRKED